MMKVKKNNIDNQYVFLFADLIGSTELAKSVNDLEYKKYISSFYWAVNRAKSFIQANYVFPNAHFRRIIQNIGISGDEVYSYSIIHNSTSNLEKEDLIASSISFIYMLQLYWLAGPFNFERMRDNKPLMEISAGLHMGNAIDVPAENSNVLASLHINFTKGIEGKGRTGKQSRIFVTNGIKDLFNSWKNTIYNEAEKIARPPLLYTGFGNVQKHKLKGMNDKTELYELKLLYNENKQEFNQLFDDFTYLKEEENYQAETAAMIMATNFIICRGKPFRYSDGKIAIPGYKFKNAANYINSWFQAYNSSNLDFINNSFMALNYSIISGALLRHPEINKGMRNKYINICKTKYKALKSRYFK